MEHDTNDAASSASEAANSASEAANTVSDAANSLSDAGNGTSDADSTAIYMPDSATVGEHGEQPITGAFRYALVVERGPRAGLSYVLGDGETTAGREADSDIFLADITVSRSHCRFLVDGGGLSVEDMGSTNGTYVNGRRRDRIALQTGDEVIIGKFHLIVAQGDA